jgi:hypothetical protein
MASGNVGKTQYSYSGRSGDVTSFTPGTGPGTGTVTYRKKQKKFEPLPPPSAKTIGPSANAEESLPSGPGSQPRAAKIIVSPSLGTAVAQRGPAKKSPVTPTIEQLALRKKRKGVVQTLAADRD